MNLHRALGVAILLMLLMACPAVAQDATTAPLSGAPQFPGGNLDNTNSISGIVYDASGHGIPNARVTLYNCVRIGNDYKAKDKVTNDRNPQNTGDGQNGAKGIYGFMDLSAGAYVLTAEKDGISVSQVVWVTGGTTSADLFIQGYVQDTGVSTAPAPTPVPTYRPPPTATPDPGINFDFDFIGILRVLLMGVVGLQLVASIAIFLLHASRR